MVALRKGWVSGAGAFVAMVVRLWGGRSIWRWEEGIVF